MNKDIYEIGYGYGEEDYGRSIYDCDKAIARHNTLNGSALPEYEEGIFYDGYSDAQDTCRAEEDHIREGGF
ncbi:MAG: hypothetical protein ABF991_00270 [Liquorilactobacillus hordei]|uniref:hypothetical protein n=1 Tax=Liquorilactobacillus hordei TaxID=468911 RepID=UPI0039E8DB8A